MPLWLKAVSPFGNAISAEGATVLLTPNHGAEVALACLYKARIARSPLILHWLAYISVNAPISYYDRVSQTHAGEWRIS